MSIFFQIHFHDKNVVIIGHIVALMQNMQFFNINSEFCQKVQIFQGLDFEAKFGFSQ